MRWKRLIRIVGIYFEFESQHKVIQTLLNAILDVYYRFSNNVGCTTEIMICVHKCNKVFVYPVLKRTGELRG